MFDLDLENSSDELLFPSAAIRAVTTEPHRFSELHLLAPFAVSFRLPPLFFGDQAGLYIGHSNVGTSPSRVSLIGVR